MSSKSDRPTFMAGQRVRVTARFFDPDSKQDIEPVEPTVIFMSPARSMDTRDMTLQVDAPVPTYAASVVVEEHGEWLYRIETGAPLETVVERSFYVQRSRVSA